MAKITYEQLRVAGHKDGIDAEKFRRCVGEELDVTVKACVEKAADIDFEWLGRILLNGEVKKIYESAISQETHIFQSKDQAYRRSLSCSPMVLPGEKYGDGPAFDAYNIARQMALTAYNNAENAAKCLYVEMITPHSAAFKKAKAEAFARAYLKQEGG